MTVEEAAIKLRYEELQFHVTVVDEVWLAHPEIASNVSNTVLQAINRDGIKILTY